MKYFFYNIALIILLSTSYGCKKSNSTKIKIDVNSDQKIGNLYLMAKT